MSDKTKRIIKERLSVLAVILSCMALVVVAQEVQQLLAEAARPTPTSPAAAAATSTPQSTPKPAATSLQDTAGVAEAATDVEAAPAEEASAPTQAAPQKPVNFSGKWVGTFSETLEGNALEYQYTLELVQQGTILSGKSAVAKADDPNINARFIIRGKVVAQSSPPAIQLTEDLFAAQGLHTGSAGAPRTTQLSYSSIEGLEVLEGEWVDRRNPAAQVTGMMKLTRQP